MKLPLYIATRYLLAKKSHNLINIITWISVISVCVASFAMIFVLSVFNGFESVITNLIHQLSPDISITAKSGKTINLIEFPVEDIKTIRFVEQVFPTITEDALFKNDNRQQIGKIKGVPDEYGNIKRIRGTILNDSVFEVRVANRNYGIPGAGMAYYLGVNIFDMFSSIQVFVPKRGNASSFNIDNSFSSGTLLVKDLFSTQQDTDEKLIIAPFDWLSNLIGYDSLSTEIEVFTTTTNVSKIKKEIHDIIGDDYYIHDQYEQQATMYKMMRSEKLAVFMILAFILIMATFNVISSLSMLILEKKKDIGILRSLGADNILIKRIFLTEGTIISVVGGLLGLMAGIIAVALQQHFGIIRMGEGNYVIDAYPVALQLTDIILVFVTIIIIGGSSALLTVRHHIKSQYLKD